MSIARKLTEYERLTILTQQERPYWKRGRLLVAGADEAGRGPIAGPVVAACVVMPPEPLVSGINDSKKVSEKKRELLYEHILECAVAIGVGMRSAKQIDEIGIAEAVRHAFRESVSKVCSELGRFPDTLFTDFVQLEEPFEIIAQPKADANVYNVAAASIVAKVTRDRMMREYAEQYPEYGFERHMGYGTAAHREALEQYGMCPIHRHKFVCSLLSKKKKPRRADEDTARSGEPMR